MKFREIYGFVMDRYPGQGWKDRVQGMEDDQILALYRRFKQEDEKPVEKPKPEKPEDDNPRLF